MQSEPTLPLGYIAWPMPGGAYALDIPGVCDTVAYASLQDAAEAAWTHFRSTPSATEQRA